MTITETARVFAWLRTTLNPLATGGAWQDIAPNGTQPPYVVYGLQSAVDRGGVAAVRLWQDGLYLVKVVGKASGYAGMVSVADAVDTALQLATGNTADGTIIRVARETSIAYSEIIDGEQWSHLGGQWRIYSKKI